MAELIILGAGISGLAAAYYAEQMGKNYKLYEAKNRLGGLLDNFTIDGFRFDQAVHLSFTSDEFVRSIFDRVSYHTHKPEAYNYFQSMWIKHPVQNNLYGFDVDEKIKLLKSLLDHKNNKEIRNYQEWLVSQYGEYFCSKFSFPYTRKYWCLEPEFLGIDWVGNRVRKNNFDEVLYGALSENTPSYYYATEMRYPKKGGYKSFIKPLISTVECHRNHIAVEIDLKHKYVMFDNGAKEYFKDLICTIPLPKFVSICKDVPKELKVLANQLLVTEVDLVSIGFSDPDIAKHLWFYIYDEEILPARVYSPNLKSLDNVPSGCSSLQFEMYSCSKHKKIDLSSDDLKDHVIKNMKKMGVASENLIRIVDHRKLRYGNVIYDIGMESRRDKIIDYFKDKNVKFAGRFGQWEYYWSDQALLSGIEAAKSII